MQFSVRQLSYFKRIKSTCFRRMHPSHRSEDEGQLMSRTAAKVTQADIARSIRAAKQAGAGTVELLPDGTIRISLIEAAYQAALNGDAPRRERGRQQRRPYFILPKNVR